MAKSWTKFAAVNAWDERKDGATVDAALKAKGITSPVEARSFRDGWRRGRISEAVWTLQKLMKYLKAADMQELGDELQQLANKYEQRLDLYGKGDD